ncbi:helix-turn-helix domain-containing protein [Nocardia sp. 852002-51244_SCH5132740]|uniref:helix-turn-helix domain-containing protein n=1 Tax=Nocardia sp. 852002-51244_SCH5132740 TaxID=1834099 RepID=UPI0009EEBBE5|nr:helix-turn-helix domain-containing protein [Nocardia sp. 852002-51244_SCH5132740]
MDQLLTAAQLAEYLDVTEAALAQDRYHRRGVSYIKHGNRVRYRMSDVLKYLQDNTIRCTDRGAAA